MDEAKAVRGLEKEIIYCYRTGASRQSQLRQYHYKTRAVLRPTPALFLNDNYLNESGKAHRNNSALLYYDLSSGPTSMSKTKSKLISNSKSKSRPGPRPRSRQREREMSREESERTATIPYPALDCNFGLESDKGATSYLQVKRQAPSRLSPYNGEFVRKQSVSFSREETGSE